MGGVEADMEVSGGEVGGDGEERWRESWPERADRAKSGTELRRAQKMAGARGELSDRDSIPLLGPEPLKARLGRMRDSQPVPRIRFQVHKRIKIVPLCHNHH